MGMFDISLYDYVKDKFWYQITGPDDEGFVEDESYRIDDDYMGNESIWIRIAEISYEDLLECYQQYLTNNRN
jgi:hypothetical protein